MRNKLKVTYQQNKIKSLELEIKELKQENKTVCKENESLKRVNEELYKNIESMKREHESVLGEYRKGMKEISDLRVKYKELISSATKFKKEYNDKIKPLLNSLGKQK